MTSMLKQCYGAGIAPDCGLDGRGSEFEFRKCQEFTLLPDVQTDSGGHSAPYPLDSGALASWIKRPEREAD
jgi:hypothetical protein